jgi:hypothetical protein
VLERRKRFMVGQANALIREAFHNPVACRPSLDILAEVTRIGKHDGVIEPWRVPRPDHRLSL